MINVDKNCCGCTACADICPTNAIEMTFDEEGFLYPQINTAKCKNCSLCDKVCPAIELPSLNLRPKVYALQLTDEVELAKSQSGGAFWTLVEFVLDKGGVIYGAGFDKDLKVVHKRATTISQAQEFHGSKYVQTDMRGILSQVKKDLLDDKIVLFSGTACHVAGLYKYLGKDFKNLITCDFVCHGVPSPKVYQSYLNYIEQREKSKVEKFAFGYYNVEEGYGWNDPRTEYIWLQNGKQIRENKYGRIFSSNWAMRPYCSTCPFAKTERVADFTIGDLWGVEKHNVDVEKSKGVSFIMINNSKAQEIFFSLNNCYIKEIQLPLLKQDQINLNVPSGANKRRKLLFKIFNQKGFYKAYKKDRFFVKLYELKQKLKRK